VATGTLSFPAGRNGLAIQMALRSTPPLPAGTWVVQAQYSLDWFTKMERTRRRDADTAQGH
jgi:hypothetical protein